MDDAFEDLKAALEFGATLDLTIEQRRSLTDLCAKIAGKLIPAYRLAESQELKKTAVARAEAAERRVIELEGALKYQRREWQLVGRRCDTQQVAER
jgi:hypothetical protein